MGKIKGWRKTSKYGWENLDAKQRIIIEWTYKTSKHNLYNVIIQKGSITTLLNFATEKVALKEAINYMRLHPNG